MIDVVLPRQPMSIFAGLAIAPLLAVLVTALAGPEPAPAAAKKGCPAARKPVTDVPERTLRRSITCLVNKQRARRDLKRLDRNKKLKSVAQRHAEVMVEEDCFDHTCPGEPPLEQRIRKSGYLDGARRWSYAQNTGCALTTKAMIRHWLKTRFHRRNMLERRFRDVGAGAVHGGPPSGGCRPEFATFTVVFARRSG